jgi:hypothetical protein
MVGEIRGQTVHEEWARHATTGFGVVVVFVVGVVLAGVVLAGVMIAFHGTGARILGAVEGLAALAGACYEK